MTTQPTGARAASETDRAESRPWQAPKLTKLGELDSHTGLDGGSGSDGDGSTPVSA